MRIKPQADYVSIVLVGRFNPAIFQPAWFALNKMLGAKEAEAAKVQLIHAEISQFKVEQFELQATEERFSVTSLDSMHPEHIKDLVISCFGQCLPHVPVRAMGLNRAIHFDTGDFDVRDRVGTRLAPKEPWGKWGEEIASGPREPVTARGGMTSLSMKQSLRPDGRKGHIQAKVEPSSVIPNTGIFVDVNDHYDLIEIDQQVQNAAAAVAVLETNWGASLARSAMIIDQIMDLTGKCR